MAWLFVHTVIREKKLRRMPVAAFCSNELSDFKSVALDLLLTISMSDVEVATVRDPRFIFYQN